MEILTFWISLLSLLIGSVAYYRSGGRQDIRALEQALNKKVEDLAAGAQRIGDNVTAGVRAGYERSMRMISDLRSRVTALQKEALEEIREDLGRIARILDRLAERAAREINDLRSGINATLTDAEMGLRLTVEDAKAHLKVIEAKRELVLARVAISRNDLLEVEARVESALRHLDEAQSLAVGYHESLAVLQKQTQEMLVAVRTKAATMKASIDAVIERSNRLLGEMNSRPSAAKAAA